MSVPSEPTRAGRVARAALATSIAVVVALAAHLVGGGGAPPAPVVLALALVLLPAAVLLTGRRPRLWRQATVVGLAQASMHGLFAVAAGTAPAEHLASMPGMPGMTEAVPAVTMPVMHAGPGMFAWHTVAWALTVVAWRWGEQAVVTLLAEALTAVRLLAAAVQPAFVPRPPVVPILPMRPGRSVLTEPLRGPPSR